MTSVKATRFNIHPADPLSAAKAADTQGSPPIATATPAAASRRVSVTVGGETPAPMPSVAASVAPATAGKAAAAPRKPTTKPAMAPTKTAQPTAPARAANQSHDNSAAPEPSAAAAPAPQPADAAAAADAGKAPVTAAVTAPNDNIPAEPGRAAPAPTASAPMAAPAFAPAAPSNTIQPAHDPDTLFSNESDGFGDTIFETARGESSGPSAASGSSKTPQEALPDAGALKAVEEIEAIRGEGLTSRQLRFARHLAQAHGIEPADDFDAVRQLRARNIDPLRRGNVMELVAQDRAAAAAAAAAAEGAAIAPGRALAQIPAEGSNLPARVRPAGPPSTERKSEVNHAAEILQMQQKLVQRRRRKVALLLARLCGLVLLPTLVAGWYFAFIATKQYGVKSEFAVHMAAPASPTSGLGGLLQGTSMATAQDSMTVQGYLQSRDAMLRLEADTGFRRYFEGPEIDPLLRLPPDASMERAFKLYKDRVVISYDPTEGIIRMEVIAPSGELGVRWSEQLIRYAEEQVDKTTQRVREDAMKGANEGYTAAEAAITQAQQRVIDLQQEFQMFSSESEATILTTQIGGLENQITQERLSLAQMEANPTPNMARMEPIKRRIASLEEQIQLARKRLTDAGSDGKSLAQIQGQLQMAQADVATRQMMLAQSLQSMEMARSNASRQTRYLTTSVAPIAPDEATYPRAFENTLVTMLILFGIYLMISMTLSILREQVSS